MKKFFLTFVFSMLILWANAQRVTSENNLPKGSKPAVKLFREAFSKGRPYRSYYVINNENNRMATAEYLVKVCDNNNYFYKGNYNNKQIRKFGLPAIIVNTFQFIPKEEYIYYVFEWTDRTKSYGKDLTNKGTVYFFDHDAYSFITLKDDALWTGNVVNGFVEGSGAGIWKKDESTYYYFSGTFKKGFPVGKAKYRKLVINDNVSWGYSPREKLPSGKASNGTPFREVELGEMKEDMALFRYLDDGEVGNKGSELYGYVDVNGNIIYRPIFEKATDFGNNGTAEVVRSDIVFEIDKKGNFNLKKDQSIDLDNAFTLYKEDSLLSKILENYFLQYTKECDRKELLKFELNTPNLIPQIAEFRNEINPHDTELLSILNGEIKDKQLWAEAYIENAYNILKRNDEYMCKPINDKNSGEYPLLIKLRRIPLISERLGEYHFKVEGLFFNHSERSWAFLPDFYSDLVDYSHKVSKKNGSGYYDFKEMQTLMQGLAMASRVNIDLFFRDVDYFNAFRNGKFDFRKRISDAIEVARKLSDEQELKPGCDRSIKYLTEIWDLFNMAFDDAVSGWREVFQNYYRKQEQEQVATNSIMIDDKKSVSPSGELVSDDFMTAIYYKHKNDGAIYDKNGRLLIKYNKKYNSDKSFEHYYIVSCIDELKSMEHYNYKNYNELIDRLKYYMEK